MEQTEKSTSQARGCSNCGAEQAQANVLCPWCLDLYYQGQQVKGRFGMIQSSDGPPVGYQPPAPRDQLDLFN